MPQPLVIAYHLIWTAYGWWLPNDPRGSGSQFIQSDPIAFLGELHFGRKRLQPAGREVHAFYDRAASRLLFPLLIFDDAASAVIAEAFADAIEKLCYTCYPCAIMPDHVHILIRKHKHLAEEMIETLRSTSRDCLIIAQRRTTDHPTWTNVPDWHVFLNHPDEVRRTIRYIEQNPLKIGLPAQCWSFVKPYDGWPLHPGHSPNSPYAKRLRAEGRYP